MVNRRVRLALWWRNAGAPLRLALFFTGSLLLGLLLYIQKPEDPGDYSGSNLVVFVFLNLSVVFLCLLVFLVGRNVVKLIFDRRRRILGSKLRMKLVASFVGLTLIPTMILFTLSTGLLSTVMEGWFGGPVEAGVQGALELAREHYAVLKRGADETTARIAERIEQGALDGPDPEAFLENERKGRGFFRLEVLGRGGARMIEVHNAAAAIETFKDPPNDPQAIEAALSGVKRVLGEEQGASRFVRVYQPLSLKGEPAVLVGSARVNAEISNAMEIITTARNDYEQLKIAKNRLRSQYLLTLAIVTGVMLFSAIWVGFYIARDIAVPLQRLAEGTTLVARGNYDVQIRAQGDDEMAFLVRSFNKMTQDLKLASSESERRRLFIESILSNLAVGVVALNTEGVVTSVNQAAIALGILPQGASAVGFSVGEALAPELREGVAALLAEVDEHGSDSLGFAAERELTLVSTGRALTLVCTAGRIHGIKAHSLGSMLLFDDVTELSKAQRLAAWREVARRIAHEIKNPLTPIQLSAQRLQRLLGKSAEQSAVTECTQTIVEHVDSIKRLANEFSNFARMPAAEFSSVNLNLLISDTIAPFAATHAGIVFQFIADSRLPELLLDREQIRRLLINLIDNAIAAIEIERAAAASHQPLTHESRVIIKTTYQQSLRAVSVEVADNGPGVRRGDQARIFEPYFTTKKGGTGLGLAIVTSIVSDHHGSIRVYENEPRGARFEVQLPVVPRSGTQRRIVQDESVL